MEGPFEFIYALKVIANNWLQRWRKKAVTLKFQKNIILTVLIKDTCAGARHRRV